MLHYNSNKNTDATPNLTIQAQTITPKPDVEGCSTVGNQGSQPSHQIPTRNSIEGSSISTSQVIRTSTPGGQIVRGAGVGFQEQMPGKRLVFSVSAINTTDGDEIEKSIDNSGMSTRQIMLEQAKSISMLQK